MRRKAQENQGLEAGPPPRAHLPRRHRTIGTSRKIGRTSAKHHQRFTSTKVLLAFVIMNTGLRHGDQQRRKSGGYSR